MADPTLPDSEAARKAHRRAIGQRYYLKHREKIRAKANGADALEKSRAYFRKRYERVCEERRQYLAAHPEQDPKILRSIKRERLQEEKAAQRIAAQLQKFSARQQERQDSEPERKAKKKAIDRAYYLKNRERILARMQQNKEEITRKDREWRAANLERERAKGRERMRAYKALVVEARNNGDPDGIYAKHKAREAASLKKWRKKNQAQYRAQIALRAARDRAAEGSHTADDIQRIKKDQRSCCAYCRKPLGKRWHIDHVTPLALGGTNWPDNIQLTCVTCNTRKNAKDPIDFAQSLGLLL